MLEIKDFSGRREGERVEFFVRSSPLYLAWQLLLPSLLTVVGFVLAVALPVFLPIGAAVTVLIAFVLLTLPLLWVAWRFYLWYNDYFIITNLRILDFSKKPFTYEQRTEAMLSRIQDVRFDFPNPLTTNLNIGNVYVQTAGMAGQLTFRYAANPSSVQARLLHLVMQSQRPQARPEPLGQLLEAMKLSVEPSARGTSLSGAGPLAGSSDGQSKLPQPRKRTFRDLLFYSPVAGTNQITWRKHWWILVKALAVPAAFMVLILALPILAPNKTIFLITGLAFLADLLFLGYRIIDWYNDVYIITDDRIVDVEKAPLTSEDRREARLTTIQDVHYTQPNLTTRLLGFGDVIIETAAKTGAFTFNNVPNPKNVQREIFARLEQSRQPSSTAASAETAQEFVNWLDRYLESKQK